MAKSSALLTMNNLSPYIVTILQSYQPHFIIKVLALSFHIQETTDPILDL
jgi:hypothetical protein